MSPLVPRAVEGRTGWGARGQAECAAHVCGVWVCVSKVGPPQGPLCLGSCGSGQLPLTPRCLPHGAPLQGCPRFLSSTCKLRGFFFFFFNSTPLPPYTPTGCHFFAISQFCLQPLFSCLCLLPNLTRPLLPAASLSKGKGTTGGGGGPLDP